MVTAEMDPSLQSTAPCPPASQRVPRPCFDPKLTVAWFALGDILQISHLFTQHLNTAEYQILDVMMGTQRGDTLGRWGKGSFVGKLLQQTLQRWAARQAEVEETEVQAEAARA